jgi:tRNA-splicing ligase RtcB
MTELRGRRAHVIPGLAQPGMIARPDRPGEAIEGRPSNPHPAATAAAAALPVTIEGERLPILSWTPDLEPGALAQARNCANLSPAFHHVAVMADGHQGYGVPIGAVLAIKDALSPYAVGNDIGCGMALVATGLSRHDLLEPVPTRSGQSGPVARDEIMGAVQHSIPAGADRHHRRGAADPAVEQLVDRAFAAMEEAAEACGIPLSTSQSTKAERGQRLTGADLAARARDQAGTLGSGNHFIELLVGPDEDVWVLIHSGSRGLGGLVCANFHRMALAYCAQVGHQLPDPGLAWLPVSEGAESGDRWTTVGRCYRVAMQAALEYAQLNRRRMLEAVAAIVERRFPNAMRWDEAVDIHHNDATFEQHFGEWVWVHRKGAVKATTGTPTITPGSMGTGSMLGRGLGNQASFCSAAHGAGRAMSRTRARRELSLQQQLAAIHVVGGKVFAASEAGLLDEMPAAYKDLDEVMANQADLVEPVRRFTPLATYKGADKPRGRGVRWRPAEER